VINQMDDADTTKRCEGPEASQPASMVERMAKASFDTHWRLIHEDHGFVPQGFLPWEKRPDWYREIKYASMRAALVAIRDADPTIEHVADVSSTHTRNDVREIWQAMIDEALK
jgi:hypothetical protein